MLAFEFNQGYKNCSDRKPCKCSFIHATIKFLRNWVCCRVEVCVLY